MTTPVLVRTFQRPGLEDSENLRAVLSMVKKLTATLNSPEVSKAIGEAHVFNASSHDIQNTLLGPMTSFGFSSEKKGLFESYSVSGIRPDYFLALDGGGILFEVERGKTIANNMDLLDVWKTHICLEARHLFLLIPHIRVNERGSKQKIFNAVENRISAFFAPNLTPIDVDTVTLFGY
jgi:hypothetical protein